MLPILIKIGPVTLRTYGLLLALGFTLALGLAWRRARGKGLDPDMVLDLGFWLILSAILGSRLLYVIQYWSYYLAKPWRILMIWEGGLVFFGGLIGAVITAIVYLRLRRAPALAVGDLLAPSIALGQGIGRLGCFAAGCCYGAPFGGGWAVTFTDADCLAPVGVPLHPTQLYMSAADFLNFGLLLLIDRRRKFEGQVFFSYLIIYGSARFMLEFLRGDERGSFFGTPLSPAQGFGLLAILAGAVAWAWFSRRR